MLKKLRIFISTIIFFSLLSGFVFSAQWVINLSSNFQCLQFIPAGFKLIFEFSIFSFLIILFLFFLTFFFGRVYCSFLCPLGTLQDLSFFLSRKIRKKKSRYKKAYPWIKYSLLISMIIFIGLKSIILVNLLDPYSLFGRIGTNLILPAWSYLQTFLSAILEKFEIFALSSFTKIVFEWKVFSFTALFFAGLIILSFVKGRFYCNHICPVGTFLGLISRFAVFKIRFIESKCTRCGICENNCKASCINPQEQIIDSENCVNCFQCLQICPENALKFSRKIKNYPPELNLRSHLKKTGLIAGSIAAAFFIPFKFLSKPFQKTTILPPGTVSYERFKNLCTACHRCVSVCPTRVIEPGLLQNGLSGLFQPALNYSKSFCEYECNQCTKVCPTNAIQNKPLHEKKLIQLGVVQLNQKKCIVYEKDELCGACAEVCPTRAVTVFEYKKNLYAPVTETDTCIGCGACEFACPVRPERAIRVQGIPIQLTALPPREKSKIMPKEKGSSQSKSKDFPF